MLNTIQQHQYHELCELLGGFRNEYWMQLVNGHGEPDLTLDGVTLDGRRIGYGLCRRIFFDLDYEEYVLAQVWDHSAMQGLAPADMHWQHVLFFNTGRNEWVPEQVYSWGDYCPSYGEAGAIVDEIQQLRHQ